MGLKYKIFSLLISFVSFFLFWATPTYATTYYVDATGGNNSNNGTSTSTPWQTISKLNSLACGSGGGQLQAGDSVLFKSGETWREQLTVPCSGSSNSPITFGAYGSGAKPVINGNDILSSWTSEIIGQDFTGDANLQGYWMLEESGGATRLDGTANDNDLTDHNTVGQSTTHKQGSYSASFAKASSHYLTRSNASLSANFPGKVGVSTTDFTVGAWVQFNSVNTNMRIMTKGWGGSFALYHQENTNLFKAELNDGGRYPGAVSNVGYSDTGVWHHVAMRVKGSTNKEIALFVDGVKQSRTATATQTALSTDAGGFAIGGEEYGGDYWDGLIDEAFVFNRALTDTEIGSIYSSGLAGNSPFTAYYATKSSDPVQVFEDGNRLTIIGTKQALTPGRAYYDSGNSRLYVRTVEDTSPSGHTIEAGTRTNGIAISGKQNIALSGIEVRGAKEAGIYATGNVTGLTVDGILSTLNYYEGLFITEFVETISNVIVQNSTFSYNNASGFRGEVFQGAPGWKILNNVANNNSLKLANSGRFQWSAGIFIYANESPIEVPGGPPSSNSGPDMVSGNIAHDNGIGAEQEAYSWYSQGLGIWMDTTRGATVTHNTVYNNSGPGLHIEKNINSTVTYNLAYNNLLNHPSSYAHTGNIMVSGADERGTSGVKLYHNTSYGSSYPFFFTLASGTQLFSDMIVKNNIGVGGTLGNLYVGSGADNNGTNGSGNIYEYNSFGPEAAGFIKWGGVAKNTYSSWEAAYGGNTHSMQSDPQLTDPGSANFTLRAGSPAINAGVVLSGINDGYSGSAPDLGAFEYIFPSSNSPSQSNPGPASCTDSAPTGTPDLFQIDATPTQATLYFAPVSGSVSSYYISYGLSSGNYQYGTNLPSNPTGGALSYTINSLAPNTTYYFTIRSGNGCAPGKWSNEMSAKTAKKGASNGISYFKNFPARVYSIVPKKVSVLQTTASKKNVNTKSQTSGSCEYIVQSGDSLWSIASFQLGSGKLYKEIMEKNNLDSTSLHNGQKLKVGC